MDVNESLEQAANEVRVKLNTAREIAWDALDRPSDEHVMVVFRSLLEAESRHRYAAAEAEEADECAQGPRATVH
ncbi:hypothetical protein IMZ29_00940 [Achromobacter sp. GG226]|uniref:hypothetical protein n=1 Tax=Verticiella alkaliphila TaxID=2779529 RepID=UPI001C0D23E8|nr:hypothetical protein [Verticiella sp. GG226]MBU4609169.1 hypothetical protein [Verticiella sp. GG226]